MKTKTYTALVTGASSGIGKEILRKFLKNGIHVIGTSTTLNGVKIINNCLKTKGFGCILDLKDTDSITTTIKNIYNNHSIDILVNNAGMKADKLLINMNPQEWENVLRVNLTSIFYTVKSVINSMIKKKTDVLSL